MTLVSPFCFPGLSSPSWSTGQSHMSSKAYLHVGSGVPEIAARLTLQPALRPWASHASLRPVSAPTKWATPLPQSIFVRTNGDGMSSDHIHHHMMLHRYGEFSPQNRRATSGQPPDVRPILSCRQHPDFIWHRPTTRSCPRTLKRNSGGQTTDQLTTGIKAFGTCPGQ